MKTDLTENLPVGSKTTEKHGIGGNVETENNTDKKQKSILIIDTPKTCEECDCHLWKVCVPADEDIDEYVNPSKTKPDWCPLRPLPQKIAGKREMFMPTYSLGWNDCIGTILGEEEGNNGLKPLPKDESHEYCGCPSCRHIVSSVQNYCENCGQKLDWRDIGETE